MITADLAALSLKDHRLQRRELALLALAVGAEKLHRVLHAGGLILSGFREKIDEKESIIFPCMASSKL